MCMYQICIGGPEQTSTHMYVYGETRVLLEN